LTRGEQPKNMENQQKSGLIFKCEAPKSARPWAFARFAQCLIRPWLRSTTGYNNESPMQ